MQSKNEHEPCLFYANPKACFAMLTTWGMEENLRILLIALLLTGCSVADIKGDYQTSSDDQLGNAKILQAEYGCAEKGLVIGTQAYDKCLNEALKDDPKLLALLGKLKIDFAKRTANGTHDDDRLCEKFGYYRGTSAYDICMEYARDNKTKDASKSTKASL